MISGSTGNHYGKTGYRLTNNTTGSTVLVFTSNQSSS